MRAVSDVSARRRRAQSATFKVTKELSVGLDNKLYFLDFILFYCVVAVQLRRASRQVWWGGPLTDVGRLLIEHVTLGVCVIRLEDGTPLTKKMSPAEHGPQHQSWRLLRTPALQHHYSIKIQYY